MGAPLVSYAPSLLAYTRITARAAQLPFFVPARFNVLEQVQEY